MNNTFSNIVQQLNEIPKKDDIIVAEGILTRSVGVALEGKGFKAPIGTICNIKSGDNCYKAVISGFSDDKFYLLPFSNITGLEIGSRIYPTYKPLQVKVSNELLGRVIDSIGRPLDNIPAIKNYTYRNLFHEPINPLDRKTINEKFDTGIKAINLCLTLGRGQRVGLFAGSGIGKSVLLGMITKFSEADVVVIGLIGERGREVQDFITTNLTERKKR